MYDVSSKPPYVSVPKIYKDDMMKLYISNMNGLLDLIKEMKDDYPGSSVDLVIDMIKSNIESLTHLLELK